jgi:hypothetical protein
LHLTQSANLSPLPCDGFYRRRRPFRSGADRISVGRWVATPRRPRRRCPRRNWSRKKKTMTAT